MKLPVIRLLFCSLVFLVSLPKTMDAQSITGIWRGYFITDQSDQYKLELQVTQDKTDRTKGVTYSYLSTIFYGKAEAVGFFNKLSKTAIINETKTVELKMSGGSIACIMNYSLKYTRSGKEEFLEGTYTSKYEKSNNALEINRGGNCGGGKVFLRKVITSDFYVEPFLRTTPTVKKPATTKPLNTAPPKNNTVVTKPAVKPPVKTIPKTVTQPPVKKEVVIAKPKADTARQITAPPVVKEEPKKLPEAPAVKIPAVTRSRQNELVQTITVKNKEVIVKLYDNGVVDGDTISVYLDNKLLLANKRLSEAPITLTINLDETSPDHTLVMVAENMGTIPPNTSLMIVHDGDKRYEVRIISTEQKNAMVRFRLQSP
jgi:hypothetical protein